MSSVSPGGFLPHLGMFKCGVGGIGVAPVAIDILGGRVPAFSNGLRNPSVNISRGWGWSAVNIV